MTTPLSERDWEIRLFIYRFFVEHARPPESSEAAAEFGVSVDEAEATYQRLHDAHALFLEPGTTSIRIANPLSAVPTNFQVQINGRELTANCAWDSLGVPAMLGGDATISAVYTDAENTNEPARYAIVNGELVGDTGLVHFPLPFRRWYDDLIHT